MDADKTPGDFDIPNQNPALIGRKMSAESFFVNPTLCSEKQFYHDVANSGMIVASDSVPVIDRPWTPGHPYARKRDLRLPRPLGGEYSVLGLVFT